MTDVPLLITCTPAELRIIRLLGITGNYKAAAATIGKSTAYVARIDYEFKGKLRSVLQLARKRSPTPRG